MYYGPSSLFLEPPKGHPTQYIVWTISNEIWFQGIFYYMSQAIQEQLC